MDAASLMEKLIMNMKRMLAPTPIAFILIMGTAVATLSLSYSDPSQQTLGVVLPPVYFNGGSDGNTTTAYVTAFSLSANATQFTATVKGVPEATTTITELFKLHNRDSSAHTLVITTNQVANAYVTGYQVKFYNDVGGLVGTLDLTAASPSVTLANMPATSWYRGEVVVTLASGAGNNNVAVTSSLSITLDP